MKIEINVSDSVSKKLAALSVLTGQKADDLESMITTILENNINSRIVAALGYDVPSERRPTETSQDTTEISVGLGDEDDSEIADGLKEMDALVPSGAGPSEAELENEMVVENPEAEAKASASTVKTTVPKTKRVDVVDGQSMQQAYSLSDREALDMFANAAGIPTEVDHRITKRQKRLTGNAKVSAMTQLPSDGE